MLRTTGACVRMRMKEARRAGIGAGLKSCVALCVILQRDKHMSLKLIYHIYTMWLSCAVNSNHRHGFHCISIYSDQC